MMNPPAGRRSETRPPPRDGDPTARLEAGDARTLAALYDRHAGVMYSLAMRVAGEQADAEAIVRGVLAAAWSEAGGHPGTYVPDVHRLLSATRIRAIDHVRAGAATGAAGPPAAATAEDPADPRARADDVATLHLPDPARRPVADEFDPEDARRLRAAFRGLPPLERLAIELAYFEGLTISRIADRLEQTTGAANARVRNGLLRLAGRSAGRRASGPTHDAPPIRELASLYALGALNAGERAAFDAHLEVHRESVDEVLSLLPVTRRLAWAAPAHEPPAGLRERVIRTVTGAPLPDPAREGAPFPNVAPEPASESPEPASAGGDTEPAADAGAASVDGSPEPADAAGVPAAGHDGSNPETTDGGGGSADPVPPPPDAGGRPATGAGQIDPGIGEAAPSPPAPPHRQAPTVEKANPGMQEATPTVQQRGGRRGLVLLAAAGFVVAAGLGLFAARQANFATALQENLDAANTQARIAELETAAARRIADELRGSARVLAATDVQTLDLAGQPAAAEARGRLYWSPGEGGVVTVTGLPEVPPGRVYQLWLIPDTTPTSAALLEIDPEGRAMAVVTPPEGMTALVPAAVTLEPSGGTASPGGDVYLLGRP